MNKIFETIKKNKVAIILISVIVFSIIYMIIPDDEWSGVNKVREIIEEKAIKDKVDEDILKGNIEVDIEEVGVEEFNNYYGNIKEGIKEGIEKEEVSVEYVKENSIFDQYFNRLYFTVITACLLGYGDIVPKTVRLKSLVIIQSLLTIIIIVL
jgi:hypothetical protein